MNIDLPTAHRLFREAHDWEMGIELYIAPNSELRTLAIGTFQRDTVSTIREVVHEIFRVIALASIEMFHTLRDVSTCRENTERDGPCSACLERVDTLLSRFDT